MNPILTLPKKFDPYILSADHPVKQNLDTILNHVSDANTILSKENGFEPIADKVNHVVTHSSMKGWIIKGPRSDKFSSDCAIDTHIYRVAKANKINRVITAFQIREFVAPEKFLYKHDKTGSWLVVTKDLELYEIGRVKLTENQAKECAILCFKANLVDVRYNLAFNEEGKIVCFDTEPRGRKQKKQIRASILGWFKWYLPIMNYLSAQRASRDVLKLCENRSAKKAIISIQRKYFALELVKLIAKTVIPLLLAVGALLAISNPIGIAFCAIAIALTGINALVGLALIILTVDGHFSKHTLVQKYIVKEPPSSPPKLELQ